MIALSLFEGALNLSWHSVRETVRKGTTGPGETSSKMDFEEIPKPPEHVVRYAMGLVSGPCIAMIILGFAVRVSEPPVLWSTPRTRNTSGGSTCSSSSAFY